MSTEQIVYLRLWQIIGSKKRGIKPLLPISETTFKNGIKTGKYPRSVKLGKNIVAWKKSDIDSLLASFGGEQ